LSGGAESSIITAAEPKEPGIDLRCDAPAR
jgi:hypothetical protein